MDEFTCAFKHTLIGRKFGCQHAREVTRREGPDIACASQSAHARCAGLLDNLRQTTIPALGLEDDLTQMPHSVLVKIQFGGLLGLQNLLHTVDRGSSVENICALVDAVETRYNGLADIPYSELVPNITGYQLRPRRR